MTNLEVSLYENAASFSAIAGEFLRSRPVHHNLILTLLDGRVTRPEPGRYWVSVRAGQVAGTAIQTDPARSALVVPMNVEETAALVDAIAAAGVVLPGVFGDAATAASFAGRWTERSKSAAIPTQGSRLYELAELNGIASVEGKLRRAEEADRKLVEIWVREYQVETHDLQGDAARQIDGWLTRGQLWLWQNGKAVSMAVTYKAIDGVVRLSTVFTPPDKRRRGYAAACVHGISKQLTDAGLRCILYTDLANPLSNSVYRRLGYRAVSEAIRYRFDPF